MWASIVSFFSNLTWLHGVMVALGVTLPSILGKVWGFLGKIFPVVTGWFKSNAGQAELSDLEAALPILIKGLTDSGNADAIKLASYLNEAIAYLKGQGVTL